MKTQRNLVTELSRMSLAFNALAELEANGDPIAIKALARIRPLADQIRTLYPKPPERFEDVPQLAEIEKVLYETSMEIARNMIESGQNSSGQTIH